MIPYFSTKVTPNLPGHDRRTLLDAPKLHCASGWWPMHSTFEAGFVFANLNVDTLICLKSTLR